MKILLPVEVYLKLKYYTLLSKGEISGLGRISLKGKDNIIVDDVYIFKQENSAGSTDLDKKSVALFLEQEYKSGNNINNIKLWWHSHADMTIFWSGTDISTIESLGETSDFIVSIITNKQLEIKGQIDVFKPFRNTLEDIPVEIGIEDKNLKLQIAKEIKEKVNEYQWSWHNKSKSKRRRRRR